MVLAMYSVVVHPDFGSSVVNENLKHDYQQIFGLPDKCALIARPESRNMQQRNGYGQRKVCCNFVHPPLQSLCALECFGHRLVHQYGHVSLVLRGKGREAEAADLADSAALQEVDLEI